MLIAEEPFVLIGGKKIRVDIADTVVTRTQGLSGRTSLAETDGMLFVFENADRYGFWMKDMNFAIDIIWIDPEKNIVYIEKVYRLKRIHAFLLRSIRQNMY